MKLKGKIRSSGNGYVISIPKAYVEDGNLEALREYEILIFPSVNTDTKLTAEERRQLLIQKYQKKEEKVGLAVCAPYWYDKVGNIA